VARPVEHAERAGVRGKLAYRAGLRDDVGSGPEAAFRLRAQHRVLGAPRVLAAVGSASGVLPLFLGREPLAGPAAIGLGLRPLHAVDRMIRPGGYAAGASAP